MFESIPRTTPLSRKIHYSVHNQLTPGSARDVHVELNPAVVVAGKRRKFSLSAVCLGPRLATNGPLSLSLDCDGERLELNAMHHRAERSGGQTCLTVALFAVSREVLELLATAEEVTVVLGDAEYGLTCPLGPENRQHVADFLNHPDLVFKTGSSPALVASVAV